MKKTVTLEATPQLNKLQKRARREFLHRLEEYFFSPEALDNILDFTEVVRFLSRNPALQANDRAMMGCNKILELIDLQASVMAISQNTEISLTSFLEANGIEC